VIVVGQEYRGPAAGIAVGMAVVFQFEDHLTAVLLVQQE
jgi:hypothetical protein